MDSDARSEPAGREFAKLDEPTVTTLRNCWEQGWNHGDIDTIMAPFAAEIVFSSPGIAMVTGDASRSTIEGFDALAAYLRTALRYSSGVRYSELATHVGTDSIVIVYECGLPDRAPKTGADIMRVGRDGKVVEWRCHY